MTANMGDDFRITDAMLRRQLNVGTVNLGKRYD